MPTKEKDGPAVASPPAIPQVKARLADGEEAGEDEDEDEEGGDELDDDVFRKKSDQLNQYGDRVIFMGDMNYRINGNRCNGFLTDFPLPYTLRRMIDQLLALQMHEVLLSNDQLR